ncbi:class II histocompatibility antigen, M alpha chain [Bombina bombina]|uniref:class II histocompatibility antigen, M alpha chain n=1 Tax=Bombina bombina TaxID=8345 RepID=UPI00235A9D2A|nr:class II histocompatibility antigen, M alpha chain [Bombina bombina]
MGCLVALAILLHFAAVQAQEDDHMLLQVLFYQPNIPVTGMLMMFDNEQMFRYNFSDNSTIPRIGEFKKWADQSVFPSPKNITKRLQRCHNIWENLTKSFVNVTPEAKGLPDLKVFLEVPLHIGVPNKLICSIANVFPPSISVPWRKNGWPVNEGISSSGYFSIDSAFQTFFYLNMTPTYHDSYSCNVKVVGENYTTVKYWVPEYPVPSDLLENVLCGFAFALGIVFLFLGAIFLYLTKKLHNTD